MSNHQQVTIVRDTAESNNETDALAKAQAEAVQATPEAETETPQETRPGWLPEKFQSAEDLAKAYGELEKKFSSAQPSDFSGLDKYSEEFNKTGDLSEESIQAISKMGIPEPLVRAYVDGQRAVQEGNISKVMSAVGGESQYSAMTAWAAQALPDEEVNAFNAIMDGGDMNTIMLAVQGLKARYEQSNGRVGQLIQGETSGPSGSAFRSVAEIVSAMKDPRYAKDPAYRKDVEQRVALSNALGVKS